MSASDERHLEVPRHSVPLRDLTERSAAGFGTLISAIDDAVIEQRRWQPSGRRPLTSGGYGGVAEGPFDVYWDGDEMYSRNRAIGRADLLGWAAGPGERSRLLVDEVNYHDDGGQAFVAPGVPTVFLVAPPGDDVTPYDFVALYSDGSSGMNLHPGVWHTAPLPLVDSATFDNRQGSIHATVGLWASQEWGLLLDVPLRPA